MQQNSKSVYQLVKPKLKSIITEAQKKRKEIKRDLPIQ